MIELSPLPDTFQSSANARFLGPAPDHPTEAQILSLVVLYTFSGSPSLSTLPRSESQSQLVQLHVYIPGGLHLEDTDTSKDVLPPQPDTECSP